ncbi:MAG: AAA family ATPase [Deltaproteobacteria bacterium]|nr:AAA family ATPase [Deltaproteobacteria bacterium]
MSKLKKALEKAKESREKVLEGEGPAAAGEAAAAAGSQPTATSAPASDPGTGTSEVVNPRYRQTRVVACDNQVLRRNRIVFDCQALAVGDQFKILRTRMMQQLVDMQGNSLMLTGPTAGCGTTLTAINLAFSVAQEIKRTVLLVDADLRQPTVLKYLGIEPEKGLADYLLGKADIAELLVNPGFDKITLLPGGRPLANSTELLGTPRMEQLIQEMKSRYPDRFIIFDSSPLLTTADPLVFAKHIDGILLVVEAEKTSTREVRQAMELLADKPVLGTVLNKVRQ